LGAWRHELGFGFGRSLLPHDALYAAERELGVCAAKRCESLREFERARDPLISILVEAISYDVLEGGRNLAPHSSKRARRVIADGGQQRRTAIVGERQRIGENLEQRDPERPDVRPRVYVTRALQLLGRQV
jgi:hypothetical protein